MGKKVMNLPGIILSVFGIILVGLLASFAYMSFHGTDYSKTYSQMIKSGNITNPIEKFALKNSSENLSGYQEIKVNTTDGQKSIFVKSSDLNKTGLNASEVEKDLINYASVVLKIYNLHNIPFTSITPQIQFTIDSSVYYVEVSNGNIIIHDGHAPNPDITVKTTSEEILKIIANPNYAKESVSSGKTQVNLVASKFVLLSKGYLEVYNSLSADASSYGINA